MNCVVLGASFDSVDDNRAFAEAQGFPYRLLSDVDRTVGRAYQAARPEGDERAAYPLRVAYLIDGEGVVRRGYEVADVAGFAPAVLADLASLAGRPDSA